MPNKTHLRAECACCGVVRVPVSDVTLRVCTDTARWSCCFPCPYCGLATTHETPDGALFELLAVGAVVQTWQLPAELTEQRPFAPPITPDDVLDFHLLLQRPDWFASLTRDSEADAR